MSDNQPNSGSPASAARSYWSNILMVGSIMLILAIVAAPLWR
jgi:hypothetical protein